jgi:hypothetical protein
MDPIKMLKQDHDEVKALFEKLDETTERRGNGRRTAIQLERSPSKRLGRPPGGK